METRKEIFGLPEPGRLASEQLRHKLKSFQYYEVTQTPGLWRHTTRPVKFTLVVDDFSAKYSGRQNAEHLIICIKKAGYDLAIELTGGV